MIVLVPYSEFMPHAFQASEMQRRAQDGGRVSRAWRWFSRRTIRAAGHYRDWSWRRLASYALGALAAIAISRIDPSQPVSPWLLIAGVLGALWTGRAMTLKLFDDARRRSRD